MASTGMHLIAAIYPTAIIRILSNPFITIGFTLLCTKWPSSRMD